MSWKVVCFHFNGTDMRMVCTVSFLLARQQIILFVETFLQCLVMFETWNMSFSCSISESVQGFNWRPTGSLWTVLHFKHSAVIKHVVSRTPLWQPQRGVVTQDRSPTRAPDLCQRKMVTGIALALSHVHNCLYLKRPQGCSDVRWRSNRVRQWKTDHGWGWSGGKDGVWEDLISELYGWNIIPRRTDKKYLTQDQAPVRPDKD